MGRLFGGLADPVPPCKVLLPGWWWGKGRCADVQSGVAPGGPVGESRPWGRPGREGREESGCRQWLPRGEGVLGSVPGWAGRAAGDEGLCGVGSPLSGEAR